MARPRITFLTAVTVIASIVGVVSGASPGSSAAVRSSPPVLRGAPVTNTTAGPGTQIDRVDMVTSRFGYGVAANNTFNPTNWVYLVRRNNAGTRWTMKGALPYLAVHQGGGELVPSIDFVTRLDGYVTSGAAAPGAIFETTNGGITWSKVLTP